MKDNSSIRLLQPKPWYRRALDFLLQKDGCRCCEGAECLDQDCSCTGSDVCAVREWQEKSNGSNEFPQPDQATLKTLPAGKKACIEQLFLPSAQKKRLLSLGLTCGAEVAVVNNEGGRMIIAVRDSRLGLSPEVASKITYKSA